MRTLVVEVQTGQYVRRGLVENGFAGHVTPFDSGGSHPAHRAEYCRLLWMLYAVPVQFQISGGATSTRLCWSCRTRAAFQRSSFTPCAAWAMCWKRGAAVLGEAISRRGFLAATAGATLYSQSTKHIPIGLLIYAVLTDWKKDFDGTLNAVAQMGYEGVELTQYESWTPTRGKEVRALLDGIRLKVFATHTEPEYFVPGDKMKAMIELNQILDTLTMCCVRVLATRATGIGYHAKASAELDAWKELTDVLQRASETLKQHRLACSFHNHAVEFHTQDGVKPIDILAKSKDLLFHIDVNVCRRAGSDPVAFMNQYPGKTECLLLTDGPPDANRHAPLFGEGDTPWKDVFATAENVGGLKYYLLTHGVTEMTPLETVKRDLEQYRLIHG